MDMLEALASDTLWTWIDDTFEPTEVRVLAPWGPCQIDVEDLSAELPSGRRYHVFLSQLARTRGEARASIAAYCREQIVRCERRMQALKSGLLRAEAPAGPEADECVFPAAANPPGPDEVATVAGRAAS